MKKQNTKRVLAAALAAAMLLGGAAVPGAFAAELVTAPIATATDSAPASDTMQKVYENLTKSDSSYKKAIAEVQEYQPDAVYTESLDGNAITLTGKSEYFSGTCTYTLEGDYIVTPAWQEGDENFTFGYLMLGYIEDALGEYLGMDSHLMSGYVSAVCSREGLSSKYVIVLNDEAAKTYQVKLYAAGPYDMSAMDSWYLDEELVSTVLDPLTEDYSSVSTGFGKLVLSASGDRFDVELHLAEHGGLTDLTYQSLINAVNRLQPYGYQDFVQSYTGLKEVTTETYQVSFHKAADAPDTLASLGDHYEYLTLHMQGPSFSEGNYEFLDAGETKTLKVKGAEVTKWSSSKKAVATVKNGKVTALKKGESVITATLEDGSKLKCNVNVGTNPSIKVGGKKFNKSKTYTIKRKGTLKVQISGKASSVNNVYASSNKKAAKVTSKVSATTVKIQGLKKGSSTITVKVNGVSFKIKVKVK